MQEAEWPSILADIDWHKNPLPAPRRDHLGLLDRAGGVHYYLP
jgi:hypothetical protein